MLEWKVIVFEGKKTFGSVAEILDSNEKKKNIIYVNTTSNLVTQR